MAAFTCPACQRLFEHLEDQSGPCPECGAIWNIHEGRAPYVVDGVNMKNLARQQRRMVLSVFLIVLSEVALGTTLLFMATSIVVGILAFVLILRIVVVVEMVRMARTMRWYTVGVVFVGMLMFIDGVNLFALLAVNADAVNRFRKAGLVVGFLGVSEEQVLEQLSRGLCRKCGYDLMGNVSGRCPECGEALPLAVAVPIAEVQAIPGPPPKIDEA